MEHIQNELCREKFRVIEKSLEEGSVTMKAQSEDLNKLTIAFTKVSVSFNLMAKVLWLIATLLAAQILNQIFKIV
jgi:hypothetical protein